MTTHEKARALAEAMDKDFDMELDGKQIGAIAAIIEREFKEESSVNKEKPEPEPQIPTQFFVDSINRQNLLLTEIVTELKQRPDRDRFTAACAAISSGQAEELMPPTVNDCAKELGIDAKDYVYRKHFPKLLAKYAYVLADAVVAEGAELAKGGGK